MTMVMPRRGRAGDWSNWARTERITPRQVVAPSSPHELSEAILGAERAGIPVKAVGSGHSFTGAAVAPGLQVLTHRLADLVDADVETGLVTVEAGMPLHRLNPLLTDLGLAMEILGDIDRQTIAGAISTGTHGSSRLFGSLSTQVRALEMVLADGSVVTCSPTERPTLFAAARIGLGALGVLTKVTLQCVPLYALHAVDAKMSLEETLEGVDDLVADSDHFEFFWFPHSTTALTRRFRRLPGDAPLRPRSPVSRWVDDRLVTNLGLDAVLRLGARAPGTVPAITRWVTAAVSAREFTELAPSVFASDRAVRFVEGEYAVPRAALVDVLTELRSWVEHHDEPVSFPFEVRFSRRDDIWLSPAYQRDVAYVAFHQHHRLPHERWFRVCEDVLGAADGRPHWGKMHRLDHVDLAERIPRFADFVALRNEVDPCGAFANPYLDRVLGPVDQ